MKPKTAFNMGQVISGAGKVLSPIAQRASAMAKPVVQGAQRLGQKVMSNPGVQNVVNKGKQLGQQASKFVQTPQGALLAGGGLGLAAGAANMAAGGLAGQAAMEHAPQIRNAVGAASMGIPGAYMSRKAASVREERLLKKAKLVLVKNAIAQRS